MEPDLSPPPMLPEGGVGQTPELREALHELLLSAPGQLGSVYRARAKLPRARPIDLLPHVDAANVGVVGNRLAVIKAVIEEKYPKGPAVARQAASSVRSLLKQATDPDVRAHLTKVAEELQLRAGDSQANEVEINARESESKALEQQAATLETASGVKVVTDDPSTTRPPSPTQTANGKIFLSYRRKDTRHIAGRIGDGLRQHLGDKSIFIDVDSIEPGADFQEAIVSAISRSSVLLVLIGEHWLSDDADLSGNRRLDNPADPVRIEIETGLSQNIRIIHVLIDNAQMPVRSNLPETLQKFTRCQAMYIRHETFRRDSMELIERVEEIIQKATHGRSRP